MLVLPINNQTLKATFLVVILETENLERMETADPITLESRQLGAGGLLDIHYPNNFHLMIAAERDAGPIYEMATKRDFSGIMKYVTRGWKWTDKDGKAVKSIAGIPNPNG